MMNEPNYLPPKKFHVRILEYDHCAHEFLPDIVVRQFHAHSHVTRLSTQEMERQGLAPSTQWMSDYRRWNNFPDAKDPWMSQRQPQFTTIKELHAFNQKGEELVKQLAEEYARLDPKQGAWVEPFQSLYQNIEVGDAISGWWHLRDRNYNLVVPLQQLPVSETLKSRVKAWYMMRDQFWSDPPNCRKLRQEGRDLEEHLLWELNTEVMEDADRPTGPVRIPSHITSC